MVMIAFSLTISPDSTCKQAKQTVEGKLTAHPTGDSFTQEMPEWTVSVTGPTRLNHLPYRDQS